MARMLSIARVTVTPEHEAEYVRTVQALADLGASRGQHLWLFHSTGQPGLFLEFSESRTERSHRVRASRTDLEAKLEQRLHQVAQYAPGSFDLWEEVPTAESDDAEEPEST
jgi:hypothetical protein